MDLSRLDPRGLTPEKIEKWVNATTFRLRKGLCGEPGSISWESHVNPGKYILFQPEGGKVDLTEVDTYNLGCDAWQACFRATYFS